MRRVLRVKGIKRYRHPTSGIEYCYHRKSSRRILAEFGSAEFFVILDSLEKASREVKATPGSWGLIVAAYRRSPDWEGLRPKTRLSYERAFSALVPLEDMPVLKMTRAFVFRLRDEKILPKRGHWLANYCVTVMGIVFRYAQDRGWLNTNPLAERIKKLRNPVRNMQSNRPWTEMECRVVLERAPPQLRVPLALAMCAGLRKADFLTITLNAINDNTLLIRTSKRGVPVAIPLHPILVQAIAVRPQVDALQIAVTSKGHPWTETGFNASFRTFRQGLEREGVISMGLTPHGLRHTLGTRLRAAGADDRTIADILGQRSTSMARHYSENASLPEHAKDLVMGLDLIVKRNRP